MEEETKFIAKGKAPFCGNNILKIKESLSMDASELSRERLEWNTNLFITRTRNENWVHLQLLLVAMIDDAATYRSPYHMHQACCSLFVVRRSLLAISRFKCFAFTALAVLLSCTTLILSACLARRWQRQRETGKIDSELCLKPLAVPYVLQRCVGRILSPASPPCFQHECFEADMSNVDFVGDIQ